MCTNDINNSKIVEDVHILSEITINVVDDLIKSNTPIVDEIHIHEESVNDVQNALVESSTHIPDDIDISEDDSNDLNMYKWSLVCPYRLLDAHLLCL